MGRIWGYGAILVTLNSLSDLKKLTVVREFSFHAGVIIDRQVRNRKWKSLLGQAKRLGDLAEYTERLSSVIQVGLLDKMPRAGE